MLEINTSKTKFVVFSSPQKPLPSIPPVIIARNDIPVSDCCRFLGVELDSNLKYHRHVAYIRKKMSYGIRILIKSRLYFNPSILISLYFPLFIRTFLTVLLHGATHTPLILLQFRQFKTKR
uniref:Putative tick transposon n=1 Tax=Rhipicephalus microplus TaxID=6941 RepID=A0A6G5AG74_RHIMP